MTLNGCALVAVNAPPGAEGDISAASDWVATHVGQAGGLSRLWPIGD